MNILIVEDEPKIARHLRAGLEAAGFSVENVSTGEAGLRSATASPHDALVVDIMLPGMSGLEMVRRLRESQIQTPVLFLSAKSSLEDRVLGLEEGGDDYLAKPYAIPEVVARLRAIMRRKAPTSQDRVQVADLVWEPAFRRISRMDQRVDLTPKEYTLAALLLQHLGEVVPRSLVVQALWGDEVPPDSNAVDVQMLRLRKKLDDPYETKLIHTLRGVGVVLELREDR
jgi:two-component system, OmpR family, copper resistance phosphate regulon response regulator CusR